MIEKLRQFLETSGMSQNKAADRMGVSRSALSGYLNGKYDGDIAGMDKKAALFLEQEGDRAELKKLDIPYVETGTAKKMKGWLGLAAWLGQLGIVYGGAGLGKTTVLKQYAATNPLALLIEPDTGYTAKVLLQEICHALDLSERGNIHELTEQIINCLKRDKKSRSPRDAHRILLIDEAEQLPTRALESLRRIHDKSGVAVALVGMPKLLLNLKGPNSEFKQLFSRVSVKMELGEMLPETDLKQIAAAVLKTNDEAVLQKVVKTAKGNARKLSKLLLIVDYLLQVNPDVDLDDDVIEHAETYLIH